MTMFKQHDEIEDPDFLDLELALDAKRLRVEHARRRRVVLVVLGLAVLALAAAWAAGLLT